MGIIHSV